MHFILIYVYNGLLYKMCINLFTKYQLLLLLSFRTNIEFDISDLTWIPPMFWRLLDRWINKCVCIFIYE